MFHLNCASRLKKQQTCNEDSAEVTDLQMNILEVWELTVNETQACIWKCTLLDLYQASFS